MMKHVETREKARAIMSGNGGGRSFNDQKRHHVDNIGQVMTESSIEEPTLVNCLVDLAQVVYLC